MFTNSLYSVFTDICCEVYRHLCVEVSRTEAKFAGHLWLGVNIVLWLDVCIITDLVYFIHQVDTASVDVIDII